MKTIGLIDGTNLKTETYQTVFGVATVTTTKSDYHNHLRTVMGLELIQPVKKKFNHTDTGLSVTVGWGMKNDDVPKHAHFGKNIILLNKLCYKNIKYQR